MHGALGPQVYRLNHRVSGSNGMARELGLCLLHRALGHAAAAARTYLFTVAVERPNFSAVSVMLALALVFHAATWTASAAFGRPKLAFP